MDEKSILQGIKFYEDLRHHFLLAYERRTEFFVMYVPEVKQWQECHISFLSFQHDYEYKGISREEVSRKTDGVLPEAELKKYLALIQSNSAF